MTDDKIKIAKKTLLVASLTFGVTLIGLGLTQINFREKIGFDKDSTMHDLYIKLVDAESGEIPFCLEKNAELVYQMSGNSFRRAIEKGRVKIRFRHRDLNKAINLSVRNCMNCHLIDSVVRLECATKLVSVLSNEIPLGKPKRNIVKQDFKKDNNYDKNKPNRNDSVEILITASRYSEKDVSIFDTQPTPHVLIISNNPLLSVKAKIEGENEERNMEYSFREDDKFRHTNKKFYYRSEKLNFSAAGNKVVTVYYKLKGRQVEKFTKAIFLNTI